QQSDKANLTLYVPSSSSSKTKLKKKKKKNQIPALRSSVQQTQKSRKFTAAQSGTKPDNPTAHTSSRLLHENHWNLRLQQPSTLVFSSGFHGIFVEFLHQEQSFPIPRGKFQKLEGDFFGTKKHCQIASTRT
ncbi:hypothetical protein AABB24_000265, partial [Solanum stoloniferum]